MTTRAPTDFELRVYDAVREIPRGQVSTYKIVAEYLGCRSPRAVGQALKRNPFSPRVPCHRVIASDLTIGGFAGQTRGKKVEKKRKLLAQEGIFFRNGKLALESDAAIYKFPG